MSINYEFKKPMTIGDALKEIRRQTPPGEPLPLGLFNAFRIYINGKEVKDER